MDDIRKNKKTYTPHQAKLKAENYCAYQERAQQEVRDKLYEWGLHYDDVEQITSQLITDNFLNEERFAIAYAQGKLRMKGWGKIKIKYHLKGKKVSEPVIKIALRRIDLDEYLTKLDAIISKYTHKPMAQLTASEKNKLIRHLQSKGFENELIFERIMGK
jgi:regulatory protein